MTNSQHPPHDDDRQLADLLRSVRTDAPNPDPELLAQLRKRSLQEFQNSVEPKSAKNHSSGTDVSAGHSRHSSALTNTTSRFAMKTVLTITVAVLAAFGIWFSGSSTSASSVRLADVFEQLRDQDGLQFQIHQNDTVATVWVSQPGLLRWEESPTSYRIARGSRLWRIEEEDTSVADAKATTGQADGTAAGFGASAPVDAPDASEYRTVSQEVDWFDREGTIDLFALLNIAPDDRAAFLRIRPIGTGSWAGKSCSIYQKNVTSKGHPISISVYVDRSTRQLAGIAAYDLLQKAASPIAELTLVALTPQVDEAKFKVPVQLAEQDFIGKITDTQGIVALRPLGAQRWTPVHRQVLVQHGDWIRTDVRGANAVTVTLTSQVTLVIGPATLMEIRSPGEAILHSGTVQVVRTKQSTGDFLLRGSAKDDQRLLTDPGKQLVRIDRDGRLSDVEKKPVWLAGYEGSSAEDSIGSLIVNVDGREQSLSVGVHHVTVEIRDQIARTTIEETFVNHTDSRLEGQFHFPLPQDASISGFGMWIAGELIEADIVEKQRAREIYETILREKRDPGLLEWTGGNIFKARVFPIEPHSEKRVKITYTQVLPLRGNRFRYSYALKSELLQTNPLQELNLRVLVNSAVPLSQVESPTHTCRVQQTQHSAQLEFHAQEYTPTRDFEVVCEVDHRENDVIVIPHRRGDDGYFLMQLMPPAADGDWSREVIPDGDPLNLIILCDTSGSMDSGMRQTQVEFVSTLLSSLGGRDQFVLAATDVGTQWAFEDYVAPSEDNVNAVRSFLEDRVSLGWTDLDQAFAAVMTRMRLGCQVVYVGDGIVATTQSDPAAFVNRLQQMYRARTGNIAAPPVLHAVSVGSTYESVVLKGMAALGGGSVRQISGETTPQETAFELLNEIAQPGLKNVQLDFRGIEVGALYPQTLPNIAAGTQQIIVGRYRPQDGATQSGEVIVTGILNGKPVRYAARVQLSNAEQGNSFIPRLWARGRLDALLQEAPTSMVRDEIIGLSEEFHIITPYTSLLVLETDADRERFGVKRRFEMRDGERYFAEGRNNASYELRQQQMQAAGNWRLGLRRQLLAQLTGLGRDASAFAHSRGFQSRADRALGDRGLGSRDRGLGSQLYDSDVRRSGLTVWDESSFGRDGLAISSGLGISNGRDPGMKALMKQDSWFRLDSLATSLDSVLDKRSSDYEVDEFFAFEVSQTAAERSPAPASLSVAEPMSAGMSFHMPMERQQEMSVGRMVTGFGNSMEDRGRGYLATGGGGYGGAGGGGVGGGAGGMAADFYSFDADSTPFGPGPGRRPSSIGIIHWLNEYFPNLPPVPQELAPSSEQKSSWSAEAVAISRSLLRETALRNFPGGLQIQRESAGYDDTFRRLKTNSQRTELWSNDRWLTRDDGQGFQSILHWLDQEQRGVCSESFLLGRVRNSAERDFDSIPLSLSDFSLSAIHQAFRNHSVIVEHPEQDRVILRCLAAKPDKTEVRFSIDTARHVLLSQQVLVDGKVTSTTAYSDFEQAAGTWWATRIETTNAESGGRVTSRVLQNIREVTADRFTREFEHEKTLVDSAILMPESLPTVRNAKQAVAGGTATAWDHFAMLLHWSISQKWEEAFASL
ncbi:MAG: hypothetical protein KDA96_04290, partial [Planctomycetaceae bacterium]|nr:hypothetical protein [Planctomycetaceae bacterium]